MKRKNGKRIVTFHRLRAHVKTTISNLGFRDYSEYFIGHDTSTYYRPTEQQAMEIFRKIESYLTYIDPKAMEAHQRDMESKFAEELELRDAKYEILKTAFEEVTGKKLEGWEGMKAVSKGGAYHIKSKKWKPRKQKEV